ncbi:ABC transporter ATP-binding protein [Rubripirellula tenax]|uniref:ABC transporter ATP-binding protein n=1 Tax=Rubripirellula tenax TaxID=2528015 RepID=UPI0028F447EC|nr:ABC transporter ATP-binding protein [Rubripirellula tenax]
MSQSNPAFGDVSVADKPSADKPSADVSNADAPIVQVRDLCKTYSGWSFRGRRDINALGGVSLEARAGDVFGLLGPNGAGKTTMIKILLGVVKPTSGSASMFGQRAGSTAARCRVGYLPESLRVDRHHTARTALGFYGRLSRMSSAEIDRRSDELLELVGLRGRDNESVRRFSKGMYQRLGLAQALMHDPDLLVLDEPTDGLDPVGRNEVRKVIERLRDLGKTIFLNSHILQEVEMVCSRVAIMAGGKLLAIGSIDELASPTDAANVLIDARAALGHGDSIHLPPEIDPATCSVIARVAGAATHRVTLLSPDQAAVDRLIDVLRQHGHSIVRLENKRPSLEDTFMRLVGQV